MSTPEFATNAGREHHEVSLGDRVFVQILSLN